MKITKPVLVLLIITLISAFLIVAPYPVLKTWNYLLILHLVGIASIGGMVAIGVINHDK